MIKLKELMGLERIILEIETKFKFDLDFNDAYKLHEYLIKVGKITSYAFLIQDEYGQKYDMEKLKEYHDKVFNSSVELNDEKDIIKFIEDIQEKIKDDGLNSIILNVRYWY